MTVTFEPPEKGGWVSVRDHFPRALTPQLERLLCTAMPAGEAIAFAAYGMPVETLVARPVHGHVYVAPKPLVGGFSNSLPPAPLLWIAARLVPAFRRRSKAARRALVERPWLGEAQHWYEVERAEWARANAAIQADDPDTLDAGALVAHLQEAQGHADAGYLRHFSLHGPDLVPTGLLVVRCEDWGIPADVVLPVLAGCSPASLGRGPEIDALRAAVAASGRDVSTVEELRTVAGAELDAFLATYGWRLVTGYDVDSLTLGELPELIANLAQPVPARAAAGSGDAAFDALRAAVPAADRSELEQLVADARATFGVRDDNGALTGAWPVGLLRRAMLAGGRRATAAGRLHQADHALEITVDELCPLVLGTGGPSADEVAARASDRAARSALEPPAELGPGLVVPIDVLPAPMRLVARAQLALRDTFTAPASQRTDLEGEGVGRESYRGRACVAADPADALNRLCAGDVLVACGTTPAYNMALSIAGAVVVEEGGLLSHAAVIARELGLAAVIGAAGAMRSIPDGAIVEVDPVAGRVRVLAATA